MYGHIEASRRGRAGHTALCGVMQVSLGPQVRGGKQELSCLQLSPLLRPAHLEREVRSENEKDETTITIKIERSCLYQRCKEAELFEHTSHSSKMSTVPFLGSVIQVSFIHVLLLTQLYI